MTVAQEPPTETPTDPPIETTSETPPALPSGDCMEPGMNSQCTAFGRIKMETQREIRGEPIELTASILLHTSRAESGARWIMFSMRNVTSDGPSPITIELTSFSSEFGDVITTRTEQPSPSELNLWVDVLDLPVDIPLSLTTKIGSSNRGAFAVETLVLAFDRGYLPVKDSAGNDDSLFSFTLLGVNKESASGSGDGDGPQVNGNKLPAVPAFLVALTVLAIAVTIAGRRTR